MDKQRVDLARTNGAPVAFYYPDFITVEEEAELLASVAGAPKPKWKTLLNRRLQQWGGIPHPKGMIAEEMPQWLTKYSRRIGALGHFEAAAIKAPNHCLINEYLAGQGIMPHKDGPLYYPTVATISLGTHTLLEFYKANDDATESAAGDSAATSTTSPRSLQPEFSLLLKPRSLIVLQESLYKDYMHGIDERTTDTLTEAIANLDPSSDALGSTLTRTTRTSLTFRVVEKVLKAQLRLPGQR